MNARPLWPAARIAFTGSLLLFVVTIAIGILNGLDLYSPDNDTLVGHVHAGTLGWITLALSGAALLVFGRDRVLPEWEVRRATTLAWATTGAIALYVAAFFVGDAIPGDRVHRPIVGTLLLVVIVWFLVWMFRSQRAVPRTVARLGLLLAWISLVIGGVFGVILGLITAGEAVPGLSDETAIAVADAHPPAMVVGFLILAAMAMIEWLLGDRAATESRSGVVQMWMLFVAGVVVNIGFLTGLEEELLGPANLAMIVAVVMLLVRRRADLRPSAWKGAGTGTFPRMGAVYLLVYLVLLTVVVARFVSGEMDPDAMTPEDDGLLIAFDHVMFIGVMTNALFGALAATLHGRMSATVDRVLLWGVNVGVAGFAVGLITLEALPKQIFTPFMGAALLIGIVMYLREVALTRDGAPE